MIDPDKLMNWQFPLVEHTYTADDTILYALAVGMGADPMDERQLPFVTECRPGGAAVLPTMAVVLGFPGSWMADPATGIDFARIVHGEEQIFLHAPLPASGTVRASHKVVEIVDKGAGKGATITYDKYVHDAATGTLLATVRHKTFARGDGGFAQPAPPPAEPIAPLAAVPAREPDGTLAMATLPQQALLYRLCADRNPLHCLPEAARDVGYPMPILHGLCTYGMACHALLARYADYDPARLQAFSARFSAPVFPGETLVAEFFEETDRIAFQVRAAQRDVIVLSHGSATLHPASGQVAPMI